MRRKISLRIVDESIYWLVKVFILGSINLCPGMSLQTAKLRPISSNTMPGGNKNIPTIKGKSINPSSSKMSPRMLKRLKKSMQVL